MPTLKSTKKSWIPETKDKNKSWTYDKRYHTREWRKYRKSFLMSNPLCKLCKENDLTVPANVIDHIIPLSKDSSEDNFWNSDNHQALCKSCNNRKTQTDRRK